MNTTDASDYSPLAFGTGLALGLMLVFGVPRATNAPPSAPPVDALGAGGGRTLQGDANAQVIEMIAAHRALALANQNQR
jgi:hypothetical protein